ncbi:MAG: hypothetical protein L0Y74_01910 [candidate division Zixibacteria bacterium]|nr:hypothetical protein [candidate division Zixibacteria bacterium]
MGNFTSGLQMMLSVVYSNITPAIRNRQRREFRGFETYRTVSDFGAGSTAGSGNQADEKSEVD